MKKYKKSIMVISVVTVFLLISTVTSGAAILNKNAKTAAIANSIGSKKLFSGRLLNKTISYYHR